MVVYAKAEKSDEMEVVNLSALLNEDDETKNLQRIRAGVNSALKNGFVWTAKEKRKIIGYILCELFDETQANFPNSIFISELYVIDGFRRKGIGKKLIKMVLSNHFPKKYTYFSITHDPKEKFLTDYYKSFGFEEIGVTNAGNIKLTKKL